MNTAGFAFVDAGSVVVNAIAGDIPADLLRQFERDYRVLFGAEFSVPVVEGVTVWIGGKYDPETGEFSPPVEQGATNDTLAG